MKLLSPEQVRAADQYTIENEPIASTLLMERAAKAFTESFTRLYASSRPIVIFCGTGNNGGDGLAIGRMLVEQDYAVYCYTFESEHRSDDFEINFRRLTQLIDVYLIQSQSDLPKIARSSIVIDAIFGSGLSRPAAGLYAQVIDHINGSGVSVISVDIASGLFANQPNSKEDTIVQATKTFSFQLPKLAFLLPQNESFVGDWEVLNIGLDQHFIDQQETDYCLLKLEDIKPMLHARTRFSHKGTYGHAILLAGSKGKMGAAVLAARACLRSGAGLLTMQIPAIGYETVQTAVPEAMALSDVENDFLSAKAVWPDHDAVGIGPGLGKHQQTTMFLQLCLQEAKNPLVLDADALNILSENSDWLDLLPKNSILTPHPKEFSRLVGNAQNDYDRLRQLIEFSKKYQVITVLKGAYSAICNLNGQIFFNKTGNPGMATAGSGDVLTGLLTGLLAQGHSPLNTAKIGVYLHGLAGDLGVEDLGQESLLATDIINYVAPAYRKLHKS
ncbi:MAG: NAD(P)H-hydrate dehydratase [Cyclobacteriaceae bacterium]